MPESIHLSYGSRTARELHDEGLLQPFYVQSRMQVVEDLTEESLRYLDSPEGKEVLMLTGTKNFDLIHPNKLPAEVREFVDIHPEKLPSSIRQRLERAFSHSSEEWIAVDSRFASFYMTLLATRLSDNSGMGLLTDMAANSKLANAARLNASLPKFGRDTYDYSRHERNQIVPESLSQGILADLVIERIQIDPETSVEKLLRFRSRHADELGRFWTEIAKLTKSISDDQPLNLLQQKINDSYINEVQPTIKALKEGLNSSKIKWVTENFLKVSVFSTGTGYLLPTLLSLSVPQAVLVGVGVSLVASAVLYNVDKAEKLRQNPYSYLLAAEKAFR